MATKQKWVFIHNSLWPIIGVAFPGWSSDFRNLCSETSISNVKVTSVNTDLHILRLYWLLSFNKVHSSSSLNNSRCGKLLWPWLGEAFVWPSQSRFFINWDTLKSNGADSFIRCIIEHSQPQLHEILETHGPAGIGHTSNWVESPSSGIIFKTTTGVP